MTWIHFPHYWPFVVIGRFPSQRVRALCYYFDVVLSHEFQPMAAQLSLKAMLPLAEIFVTASDHCSSTGPCNVELLMFSLLLVWEICWTNSSFASDLRNHDTCDVIQMDFKIQYITKDMYFLHARRWILGGGNQYSWLLFSSEDHLCANLYMQEQSANMTSQCQYLTFAWHHKLNCGDVTMPSQKRSSLVKMAKWAIDDCFSGSACSIKAQNNV